MCHKVEDLPSPCPKIANCRGCQRRSSYLPVASLGLGCRVWVHSAFRVPCSGRIPTEPNSLSLIQEFTLQVIIILDKPMIIEGTFMNSGVLGSRDLFAMSAVHQPPKLQNKSSSKELYTNTNTHTHTHTHTNALTPKITV